MDNIIKTEDFDFYNILLDKKSYRNILVYDISYNTLIGTKQLGIRFDKIDGFIRIYESLQVIELRRKKSYNL